MFGWARRREQLLEEMEEHIAFETQENIDSGMPPAEARRAAKVKFGSPLIAMEASREVWGWMWLERIAQDVRYAWRSLRNLPTYTLTLVATLALGLGSVTAMLAVVESILLRPVELPYPEQLVQIYAEGGANGMSASPQALSYTAIDELKRNANASFEVGAYNTMVRPVRTKDDTRVTVLVEVTPEFFRMLGVEARLGRVLDSRDLRTPGVMVSDEFWRDRLHSDPHALGSTIAVAGTLQTLVGVLPAGVHVPFGNGGAAVYIPIAVKTSGEDGFGIESAAAIARLKPGVTREQALAAAQSVFIHTGRKPAEQLRRLGMRSYRSLIVNDVERPLLALLGGVIVLLLIACANAANLQIGRATNRIAEMSLRSALGASFGRLLQQLVTESILVSLVGALLGGEFAYGVVTWVRRTYGGEYPRFDELAVRPSVLAVATALAVLIGIVATIAPMVNIRKEIAAQFVSKSVTRQSLLPRLLVAFQVALTCVLLVVSGLFLRTIRSLENVGLGFDPTGVTTLILMPTDQKQAPERSREIETQLLHGFEALPGVQSVTMQTEIPFSSYNMTLDGTTELAGRPFHAGDNALYSLVSTNFVQTSGIRLISGRGFEATDEGAAGIVVLVNQAFVKKYSDVRGAIGATLHFHREQGETDADLPFTQAMTVVGVVENEIQGGDLSAPYKPMVYMNYLQLPESSLLSQVFTMSAQYAVRSSLPQDVVAAELRHAVRSNAPEMAEMSLDPMQAGIDKSLGQRRLALRLVAGFGGTALLLSAVGIYGVLTYSVALRRREIGIRMALGSTRFEAAALVIRQASAMVLLGVVLGGIASWSTGYAVRSFLYGVRPFDLTTLIAVAFMLVLVAGAASLIPTIKATTVDPTESLRAE